MTRQAPALPDAVARADPLSCVLRAIRSAAAALEAGRSSEARGALGEAARLIVILHTEIDAQAGAEDLARAFRRIAFRLKDADLLRDPGAARDAERAFLALAKGLRARRGERGDPS
jgi:hypothetical protein